MNDANVLKVITTNLNYCKEIDKLAEPICKYLGTKYFGYLRVDSSGKMQMVNNLHGWLRHYFENKFYENDPHVVHPDNIVAGLTLWGSVTDDELQYKSTMLLAAHELFDFHCGASLIRKHTEYYEIFMFNHYQGNKYKVYAKYMNQQFCLEHFADYFLKQGAGILKELPAIDIAALKSRFNTQKGILAEIIPEPSWI